MAAYVVTYDLNRPGQDYPDLIKLLEAYTDHWHYQKSCWIVGAAESALEVAENLRHALDVGDVLFVQQLTEDSAWWGYDDPEDRIGDFVRAMT